ncbi:MAG TPA: ABC transporter permease, partial [Dehalococcoidia bacterium]|nr:ABC transporter permease [Dehalococcoidia bacterium]
WSNPGRSLSQLIFPAFAVGFGSIGILARMTRSSLLEVLREDYIRTAHAKGLGERVIIIRHALRNALLPVMTILGLQLGFALGGLVVVEVAFNLPGAGRFLYEATVRRDYNVVQASLLGVAVFVTLANLLVDIAYAWVDPRIRYK